MPLSAIILGVMAGAMPIAGDEGDIANFDLAEIRASDRDLVASGNTDPRSPYLLPDIDEPSRQRAKFRWRFNKVKLRVPIASI